MPQTPALTTDCVVFDATGRVLLIRRKHPPFQGHYALPGGFVEIGETVEAACARELLEETGLRVGPLKPVGVFSDPKRDPRGHTVSVAFTARLDHEVSPVAGDDAAVAAWISDWHAVELAFDHAEILRQAEQVWRCDAAR